MYFQCNVTSFRNWLHGIAWTRSNQVLIKKKYNAQFTVYKEFFFFRLNNLKLRVSSLDFNLINWSQNYRFCIYNQSKTGTLRLCFSKLPFTIKIAGVNTTIISINRNAFGIEKVPFLKRFSFVQYNEFENKKKIIITEICFCLIIHSSWSWS